MVVDCDRYTLYGILGLVFIILLVVTACISVALTYFQLSAEDHRWWWQSIFSSGATGFFVFGYSVFYFYGRSNMDGAAVISVRRLELCSRMRMPRSSGLAVVGISARCLVSRYFSASWGRFRHAPDGSVLRGHSNDLLRFLPNARNGRCSCAATLCVVLNVCRYYFDPSPCCSAPAWVFRKFQSVLAWCTHSCRTSDPAVVWRPWQVGFLSSLQFVRYIYNNLKID